MKNMASVQTEFLQQRQAAGKRSAGTETDGDARVDSACQCILVFWRDLSGRTDDSAVDIGNEKFITHLTI